MYIIIGYYIVLNEFPYFASRLAAKLVINKLAKYVHEKSNRNENTIIKLICDIFTLL